MRALIYSTWEGGVQNMNIVKYSRGNMVIPENGTLYMLFIDKNQRFSRIKGFLRKSLLSIVEILSN